MKKLAWLQRRKDAYRLLKRIDAPKPTDMRVHENGELTIFYDSRAEKTIARSMMAYNVVKVVDEAGKDSKLHWIRFAMPERQEMSK